MYSRPGQSQMSERTFMSRQRWQWQQNSRFIARYVKQEFFRQVRSSWLLTVREPVRNAVGQGWCEGLTWMRLCRMNRYDRRRGGTSVADTDVVIDERYCTGTRCADGCAIPGADPKRAGYCLSRSTDQKAYSLSEQDERRSRRDGFTILMRVYTVENAAFQSKR